jgi:photosystem II stability/assembly factor-like uncharacterized protein
MPFSIGNSSNAQMKKRRSDPSVLGRYNRSLFATNLDSDCVLSCIDEKGYVYGSYSGFFPSFPSDFYYELFFGSDINYKNGSSAFRTWNGGGSNQYGTYLSVACSLDGQKMICSEYLNSTTGFLKTSSDGNATWTDRTSAIGGIKFLTVNISSNGLVMYAIPASGNIYKSTDSGATWSTLASVKNWGLISTSADGTSAVAIANTGTYHEVWTTSNSGATWTQRTPPSNIFYSSATMSPTGKIWLGASNDLKGLIHISNDNGATWTSKTFYPSSSNAISVRSISFSTDETRIAVAMTSSGAISPHQFSIDSGSTWKTLSYGVNNAYNSSIISPDGNAIVVNSGYYFDVYKYDVGPSGALTP